MQELTAGDGQEEDQGQGSPGGAVKGHNDGPGAG